jgi:anti-sigma-K factor RskA
MGGDERLAFEAHLRTCAECQAEVSSLAPVNGALARAVPQIDPPYQLRQRVLDSALGADASGALTAEALRTGVRSRSLVSSASWLAAAAALVLTAGLGVYSYMLHGRLARLEGDLASMRVEAGASRAEAEAARALTVAAGRRLDVLTAPDSTRLALAGGSPAPNASGRADWSRSRGLAVSTDNLPGVMPGRTYQVWLLTKGAPVSAGLLRPDASGRSAMVYTDLPGDVQPTGVAVSEEPEGGMPAPTGQIYLVGQFASSSIAR